MAKRYFWLKLKDDFFRDKRIKKLRKIAGGDTYTVIYLKMMLRSLETDGVIEYEGVEGSFADELSLDLDEDADNVQVTLTFLLHAGLLVDIGENRFLLPSVKENTGGESASAQRVRQFRERQRLLQCNTNVTDVKRNVNVEKEIDIEKDIDRERETDIEKETEERSRINYQEIVDLYNDTCVSFPRLTALSDKRKKAIKARIKTYKIEGIKKAFEKVEDSSFLKGSNSRNWSPNFDWIIADGNMAKILDGNYDDRSPAPAKAKSSNRVADNLEKSYEMMAQWAEE